MAKNQAMFPIFAQSTRRRAFLFLRKRKKTDHTRIPPSEPRAYEAHSNINRIDSLGRGAARREGALRKRREVSGGSFPRPEGNSKEKEIKNNTIKNA